MRRIGLIAITTVLALGVLGCSKSGNTTATTSTVASSTSIASGGTSNTASAQVAAFCSEVNTNLMVLNSTEVSTYPQLVAVLAKLEAAAPDEIKSDLRTAHDAYSAALSGDASQIEAATPGLTRFAQYVSSNCGVTLGG